MKQQRNVLTKKESAQLDDNDTLHKLEPEKKLTYITADRSPVAPIQLIPRKIEVQRYALPHMLTCETEERNIKKTRSESAQLGDNDRFIDVA